MALDRPDPLAPPEGYGEERFTWNNAPARDSTGHGVAAEPAGKAFDDGLCDFDRDSGTGVPKCRNTRLVRWLMGDLSEHVLQVDLCAQHAAALAAKVNLGINVQCMACPHTYRIERTWTWDDAGHQIELEHGLLLPDGTGSHPVPPAVQQFLREAFGGPDAAADGS